MASLSHLHHRSLHSPENFFMELMAKGKWKQAEEEAKEDPLNAMRHAHVENFLGSNKLCKITPLHQACAHKAPLEFLVFLCKMNPNFLQTRDSLYKRLPIHVALIESLPETTILKLIELDSVSAKGEDALGRYPLHYACHHGASQKVVNTLMDNCPLAVTKADSHGWLPLHVACRFGMPAPVIKNLLDVYPDAVHKTTNKGSTPVLCAKQFSKKYPDDDNAKLVMAIVENSTTSLTAEEREIDMAQLEIFKEEGDVGSHFIDLHTSSSLLNNSITDLQLSPKQGSQMNNNDNNNNKKALRKEDFGDLSFSARSPYMADKKPQMPFLGINRVDLDDSD